MYRKPKPKHRLPILNKRTNQINEDAKIRKMFLEETRGNLVATVREFVFLLTRIVGRKSKATAIWKATGLGSNGMISIEDGLQVMAMAASDEYLSPIYPKPDLSKSRFEKAEAQFEKAEAFVSTPSSHSTGEVCLSSDDSIVPPSVPDKSVPISTQFRNSEPVVVSTLDRRRSSALSFPDDNIETADRLLVRNNNNSISDTDSLLNGESMHPFESPNRPSAYRSPASRRSKPADEDSLLNGESMHPFESPNNNPAISTRVQKATDEDSLLNGESMHPFESPNRQMSAFRTSAAPVRQNISDNDSLLCGESMHPFESPNKQSAYRSPASRKSKPADEDSLLNGESMHPFESPNRPSAYRSPAPRRSKPVDEDSLPTGESMHPSENPVGQAIQQQRTPGEGSLLNGKSVHPFELPNNDPLLSTRVQKATDEDTSLSNEMMNPSESPITSTNRIPDKHPIQVIGKESSEPTTETIDSERISPPRTQRRYEEIDPSKAIEMFYKKRDTARVSPRNTRQTYDDIKYIIDKTSLNINSYSQTDDIVLSPNTCRVNTESQTDIRETKTTGIQVHDEEDSSDCELTVVEIPAESDVEIINCISDNSAPQVIEVRPLEECELTPVKKLSSDPILVSVGYTKIQQTPRVVENKIFVTPSKSSVVDHTSVPIPASSPASRKDFVPSEIFVTPIKKSSISSRSDISAPTYHPVRVSGSVSPSFQPLRQSVSRSPFPDHSRLRVASCEADHYITSLDVSPTWSRRSSPSPRTSTVMRDQRRVDDKTSAADKVSSRQLPRISPTPPSNQGSRLSHEFRQLSPVRHNQPTDKSKQRWIIEIAEPNCA